MTRRTIFCLLLTLPAIALCVGATAPIFAQEAINQAPNGDLATVSAAPLPTTGVNFIVSPPTLDLRTEPGSSVSATIKLKNNGDQSEALRIDLMKFKADATGAKPELMDLDASDVFPQWLEFSESQFTMEPKSWKTINLTFRPPEDAAPGYYFAIVFNRQSEPVIPGKETTRGAAAVLCLVQVNSSRVFHQLDLMNLTSNGFDFKASQYIYEFLPVNFTITLDNKGNVHERAVGNIFIDWVTGHQMDVGNIEVNPDKSFILPQSTRQFQASWIDGFPVWEEMKDESGNPILDKNNQPKKKLKWDMSKISSFRIGKFNAILTMAYNDGVRDIPLEAQTSFWVIPWRILIALLVLLILIIIGLKGTIQGLYDKAKRLKRYRTPPPLSSPPKQVS